MSQILRRYVAAREYVNCPDCGSEAIEEDGLCFPCGTWAPGVDEQVGRIDAEVETFSGRRMLVRAERGEHGGWSPIEATALPAEGWPA